MVSKAVYAGIAIVVVIPLAIFAVYSTTIEPEPADAENVTPTEEPRILVLSSFYPLGQFVNNVGGDRVESALVLPSGAEPHDWEPTIKDVEHMKNADVIVINGIGFETWVEDLEAVGFEGVLIDTSEGIEVMEIAEGVRSHAHGHG
ncbi:MAG: zinc ABC transporter substrate-binding protein, partial [Desulfovibrionales bacterium]|nr:zinc ABC transporter substrate-binding protein [Desulfovibrionales bacterium]